MVMTQSKKRKTRNDKNHAIYEIVIAGQSYIGITAKTQSTILKSVTVRFQKHVERARNEKKAWPLCKALRRNADIAEVYLLEVVRGKAAAHVREVELIKKHKPALNLASAK